MLFKPFPFTVALTGIPRSDSELQLFRVLQRANLLSYFDVMIELGGDDVQQLCEAGEVEFLEIMDLIGMASKPLHVRRLQKALQEWMSNPGKQFSTILNINSRIEISHFKDKGGICLRKNFKNLQKSNLKICDSKEPKSLNIKKN